MSARFAIPATSFVLKSIIDARLKTAYGTFPAPTVQLAAPPRLPPPGNGAAAPEISALYLFMHHAGPNTAWRNMLEPHVDGQGNRIARAPLVLDLYYLLTAFGADTEREAMLGIAMNALHRNAMLPRPMIEKILTAVVPPNPPDKFMDQMTQEPLFDPASQPESITVNQLAVDFDMSTKIWSALHSPLRPCAYYQVITVFLDVDEAFPDPKLVDKLDIAMRLGADPAGDDHVVQTKPL